MIKWICSVKLIQPHSTGNLRSKLQIPNIKVVLRLNQPPLFGHKCRQNDSLWIKKILSFQVDGPTLRGIPSLRWTDVVKVDMKKCRLTSAMASNQSYWRKSIKPVTQPRELQSARSGRKSGNHE